MRSGAAFLAQVAAAPVSPDGELQHPPLPEPDHQRDHARARAGRAAEAAGAALSAMAFTPRATSASGMVVVRPPGAEPDGAGGEGLTAAAGEVEQFGQPPRLG